MMQFDSIFNPTTGFTVKLMHLSDGGTFTCRPKNDETGDKDIHFDVQVDCELNDCHSSPNNYATSLTTTSTQPNLLVNKQKTVVRRYSSSNRANLYAATNLFNTLTTTTMPSISTSVNDESTTVLSARNNINIYSTVPGAFIDKSKAKRFRSNVKG